MAITREMAVKGVVFTEFFRHVEDHHGEETLDEVIVAANLPHGGAYTSVGTYPFDEMLALVGSYTAATGRAVPDTLHGFGQHCFAKWVNYRPEFFGPTRDLFDILAQINDFHEFEVRKLYPDAELPTFTIEARETDSLVLGYYSSKNLPDLAMGVIRGAASHLGHDIAITAEPAEGPLGPYTRLRIQRLSPATAKALKCPAHSRS